MSASNQQLITAYHEAGHAVLAMSLGRAIQKVSILPDQTRLGACVIKKGAVKPSDDELETAMLILLGGLAAEAHFTGKYHWGGAQQDLQMVRQMSLSRAGNETRAEKLERRALDKAEHLIAQPGNWNACKVIAEELIRQTNISGRAAKHLYDQAVRQAGD